MKKEIYEISSKYMRDLKKLLKDKKISKYDIAHASFRKNNADCVITHVDKSSLTLTFLDNSTHVPFKSYKEFMKEISMWSKFYKEERRNHIARYYKIVNAFTKHRAEMRRKMKSKNTIADRLTPEQVKTLASKI